MLSEKKEKNPDDFIKFTVNEEGLFDISYDGIIFKLGLDDPYTKIKPGTTVKISKNMLKKTIEDYKQLRGEIENDNLDEKKEWQGGFHEAILDDNTCNSCRERHGIWTAFKKINYGLCEHVIRNTGICRCVLKEKK